MGKLICRCFFLILITLLFMQTSVESSVHVYVRNLLEEGKNMTIRCQAKDHDLGYANLEFDQELRWSFNVDFWVTTLYYCDAIWGGLDWHHFDAYDARRDYFRCWTQCRWLVCGRETLLGLNQLTGRWDVFPFSTPSSSQKKERSNTTHH